MSNEIIVLDLVLKRLQVVVDPGFINLYGIILEGKILVVGFGFGTPPLTKNSEQLPKCSETEHESELPKEDLLSVKRVSPTFFDSIQALYPAGIDHIGLLGIKNGSSIQESVIKNVLKDIQVTNTPPYFEKDCENDELQVCYFHDGTLHTSNYTVMTTEEFKEKFCFLNILGDITVELPTRNKPSYESFSEMQDLAKKISEEMIFRVGKSDTFIPLNPILQSHHSTIGKVFDSSEKHKDYRTGMEVLNIYGFFPSTIEAHSESSVHAPFVIDYNYPQISKKPHDANSQQICYDEECRKLYLNVELPFDGLCVVHRERSINEAYNLLIDAAERIIYLAELHVNRLSIENDPYRMQDLCVYHFSPEELGHPISLIYTPDDPDNELEELRSGIHRCLYLSLEKPLFKKGCAMKFLDSSTSLSPLMNVHLGLRNSGLKGLNKKVGFVNGSYEYYHYMQMGLNDSGWGCAYRSLQTIVSWFILQGYTTKQIPNHKRIQEILVEIGDKEQKFLGSKTWIGSTEVAYVLECYLINISSIIINVPSGSEMYTMAPVLFDHFKFHGTPVMIGGGVAAHTIIGIDYNEDTSEVKFLILDPHYIGDDDLTTIQKKGAVGWKGMEFWDQKAFYNLCFPQRPICI